MLFNVLMLQKNIIVEFITSKNVSLEFCYSDCCKKYPPVFRAQFCASQNRICSLSDNLCYHFVLHDLLQKFSLVCDFCKWAKSFECPYMKKLKGAVSDTSQARFEDQNVHEI
jgi:hypothetical protein